MEPVDPGRATSPITMDFMDAFGGPDPAGFQAAVADWCVDSGHAPDCVTVQFEPYDETAECVVRDRVRSPVANTEVDVGTTLVFPVDCGPTDGDPEDPTVTTGS